LGKINNNAKTKINMPHRLIIASAKAYRHNRNTSAFSELYLKTVIINHSGIIVFDFLRGYFQKRHEIRAFSDIPFFGQIIYIYQKAFHGLFSGTRHGVMKTTAEIVETGAS
jgi:hypothetical protein